MTHYGAFLPFSFFFFFVVVLFAPLYDILTAVSVVS